jgi:hypothetical protein
MTTLKGRRFSDIRRTQKNLKTGRFKNALHETFRNMVPALGSLFEVQRRVLGKGRRCLE